MSQKDEQARFDAAVQTEVGKIIAAQQMQFAQMMEQAMKASLKSMDTANASLEKERVSVKKELDAAKVERLKAEKEGDKMAQAYFEGRQKQFTEAAHTELLRNLTRRHLEMGKTPRDIAAWLFVTKDFVEKIQQVVEKDAQRNPKPKRHFIEGNPTLRYDSKGRGGTIWFENIDTTFNMWWEFAGGTALVIIDIPTLGTWESRTKIPLDKRDEVLQFIGEQVVEDQTSSEGSFLIGENVLTIYAYKQ